MPSPFDFLIAGGGPSGSTAAALLAMRGVRVALIERASGPHEKVCGEFLSYEALRYLRNLGLNPVSLGAMPITRMRLASRRILSEIRLPFEAMALSRSAMDASLIKLAQEHGATLVAGRRVEELLKAGPHWSARLSDGSMVCADQAMLASGKHDIRGHLRTGGLQNGLIAFKVHVQLTSEQARELQGTVEVMLFPGGYLGLQPTLNNFANLCLVIRSKAYRKLGKGWPRLMQHLTETSPLLRERLRGANWPMPTPLALSRIPYGYLRRKTQHGLWALGDQAAVIPSFSGDGMAIAFHSAYLAAALHASGLGAYDYTHQLYTALRSQVRRATLLSCAMVQLPMLGELLRVMPALLPHLAQSTRIDRNLLVPEGFPLRRYA